MVSAAHDATSAMQARRTTLAKLRPLEEEQEGCDLDTEVAVEEARLLVEDVAALPALCTATMKAAQNKSRRPALSGPMTQRRSFKGAISIASSLITSCPSVTASTLSESK